MQIHFSSHEGTRPARLHVVHFKSDTIIKGSDLLVIYWLCVPSTRRGCDYSAKDSVFLKYSWALYASKIKA